MHPDPGRPATRDQCSEWSHRRTYRDSPGEAGQEAQKDERSHKTEIEWYALINSVKSPALLNNGSPLMLFDLSTLMACRHRG